MAKDDCEWVDVRLEPDEDEILKKCWETLAIKIPFDQFKIKLYEIKSESPESTTHYIFNKIQMIWMFSGYVSTAFTLAKYNAVILEIAKIVSIL